MTDARKKKKSDARNVEKGLEAFGQQMEAFQELLKRNDYSKEELEGIVMTIRRKAKLLEALAKALIQKESIQKLKKELGMK